MLTRKKRSYITLWCTKQNYVKLTLNVADFTALSVRIAKTIDRDLFAAHTTDEIKQRMTAEEYRSAHFAVTGKEIELLVGLGQSKSPHSRPTSNLTTEASTSQQNPYVTSLQNMRNISRPENYRYGSSGVQSYGSAPPKSPAAKCVATLDSSFNPAETRSRLQMLPNLDSLMENLANQPQHDIRRCSGATSPQGGGDIGLSEPAPCSITDEEYESLWYDLACTLVTGLSEGRGAEGQNRNALESGGKTLSQILQGLVAASNDP